MMDEFTQVWTNLSGTVDEKRGHNDVADTECQQYSYYHSNNWKWFIVVDITFLKSSSFDSQVKNALAKSSSPKFPAQTENQSEKPEIMEPISAPIWKSYYKILQ